MTTAHKLHALPGAFFTLEQSLILLGGSGPEKLPIPVWLIEHERGLVLWDTGAAPEAWDDPRAVYGPILDMVGVDCPPENRLVDQLALRGFTPDDVTHVVISHAHFDHTGGMYLFKKAKFYIAKEDLAYAYAPDPYCAGFFRREDFDRLEGVQWNLLTEDYDLFGDGSIQILRAPGHTHGELSLLVKTPNHTFVLTGDAVHLRASLTTGMPCPVDINTGAAIESINRLKQIAEANNAEIWVHHDTSDWEKYGTVGVFA